MLSGHTPAGQDLTERIKLSKRGKKMKNLEMTLKWADHSIKNLARWHNIRHLIYGLYFAMLSTFIPIFLANRSENHILLIAGAIMGQGLLVMQLIISVHIQLNHDGIEEILKDAYKNTELTNKIDKLIEKYKILRRPFSVALFLMYAANLALIGMGSYEVRCKETELGIYIGVGVITLALTGGFYFCYFKKIEKEYKEMKNPPSPNRPGAGRITD